MAKMLASSWVTTTMVQPRLSRSSRIRSSSRRELIGIEARRGLVEEQDVGVERHGPGQARPLLHAAADLRRVEILEAGQPDQGELERGDLPDLGRASSSVNSPRGRPTFSARVMELQSAPPW